GAETRRSGGCLGSWPHGKPATTAQRGQAAHRAGKSASRSVTTPEPLRLRVRSRYIYRRDIPSSSATASAVLTPTFSCSANLAITCSCARACSHSASDIFSLVHMTTDRMVFRSRRHIPGHRGPSVPTPSDSDSNSKTALLGYTRVVALDAACWLLSQKAFTFGVQELFDLVHLSGLDVDH